MRKKWQGHSTMILRPAFTDVVTTQIEEMTKLCTWMKLVCPELAFDSQWEKRI
jgi:hypothetical protein